MRVASWPAYLALAAALVAAFALVYRVGLRNGGGGQVKEVMAQARDPMARAAPRRERAQRGSDGEVALRRAKMLIRLIESEAREPEWAASMEKTVKAAAQSLDRKHFPTTRLVATECKTTLCSLRATVATPEEAQRLPAALARAGLRTFGRADTDPATGEVTWSIFFGREGHPLPQLTEAFGSSK